MKQSNQIARFVKHRACGFGSLCAMPKVLLISLFAVTIICAFNTRSLASAMITAQDQNATTPKDGTKSAASKDNANSTASMNDAAASNQQSERLLRKQTLIRASAYDLWWAWTTTEGIASFFAPDSNLELKPGGTWELYIVADAPEGSRGSEGCKLLTYVPYKMLSFEWTAPPNIPELRSKNILSRVMVDFDEIAPNQSMVKITHQGFGASPAWDKAYDYFDKAWDYVLNALDRAFNERGSELRQTVPVIPMKRWDDGAVTVTSNDAKQRWQRFDAVIPASVDEVWNAITTPAGLKSFMPQTDPQIDLSVGGDYKIWPGANSTILDYCPQRMLTVSGGAPDQFPNVKKGGTWGTYMLEPMVNGHTQLSLYTMGWTDEDEEWKSAYDYFLNGNAVYVNWIYNHFAGSPVAKPEEREIVWEAILDAPVDDVWALFTTESGIQSWMVPVAEVDMRPGGHIKTNYNPQAKIGDEGTITHNISTMRPGRMYSSTAKAPKNAPAAKGVFEETWGIMQMDPHGPDRTRLRLISCGWGTGDEWDKAEKFFTWGNRVTLERLIARCEKLKQRESRTVQVNTQSDDKDAG